MVIWKIFERLILKHLKSIIPSTINKHKVIYLSNPFVENTKAVTFHNVGRHCKIQKNYVRVLFLDLILVKLSHPSLDPWLPSTSPPVHPFRQQSLKYYSAQQRSTQRICSVSTILKPFYKQLQRCPWFFMDDKVHQWLLNFCINVLVFSFIPGQIHV